jgi:hypothetical protein
VVFYGIYIIIYKGGYGGGGMKTTDLTSNVKHISTDIITGKLHIFDTSSSIARIPSVDSCIVRCRSVLSAGCNRNLLMK